MSTPTTAPATAPQRPPGQRPRGWRALSRRTRAGVIGWGFALPFVLLFAAFTAGPVLMSLLMSFTDMRAADLRSHTPVVTTTRDATGDRIPHVWPNPRRLFGAVHRSGGGIVGGSGAVGAVARFAPHELADPWLDLVLGGGLARAGGHRPERGNLAACQLIDGARDQRGLGADDDQVDTAGFGLVGHLFGEPLRERFDVRVVEVVGVGHPGARPTLPRAA